MDFNITSGKVHAAVKTVIYGAEGIGKTTLAAQFPNLDIKVAVMGCVVNGPGEAKEADLGIAGGIGEGLLIKKGQIIRKIPEAEFIPTLRYELEHWNEQ